MREIYSKVNKVSIYIRVENKDKDLKEDFLIGIGIKDRKDCTNFV